MKILAVAVFIGCSASVLSLSPRIIGGSEAEKNEWPMIVSFMMKNHFKHFCGGTIISKKHILSAGHCLFDDEKKPKDLNSFGIVFGAHDLLKVKKEEIISPKKAILHTKYKFEIHYDLCIFEMEEIQFSNIVKPACIPTVRFDFKYKILTHMGWGLTKAGGYSARKLKKTQLHVVDRKVCDETYKGTDYLNNDELYQICTFQKGTSQCQGDSGGPVQYMNPKTNEYNLVGAISFGWPTCDQPSVISDVTYFYNWIVDRMWVSWTTSFTFFDFDPKISISRIELTFIPKYFCSLNLSTKFSLKLST